MKLSLPCLPCAAAVAEIDLRPFAVGEVSLEQAGIGGVLKHQSTFSEGKCTMVVDGSSTDWDLAVMLNNAQKEMHIRLEAMPSANLPLENLWVTVYSGSFNNEQQSWKICRCSTRDILCSPTRICMIGQT